MAKEEEKKPPVRTKSTKDANEKPSTHRLGDLFSPEIKVKTNALSRYFLDLFSEYDLEAKDTKKTVLSKTGFEKDDLNKIELYLENFFGLQPKEDETYAEFLERVTNYLHYNFPEECEAITESTVPLNLKELVEEFEAHQEYLNEIKTAAKIDVLEKYSSPSEVSRFIVQILENIKGEIKETADLSEEDEDEVILARLKGDYQAYEETLRQANLSTEEIERLGREIDSQISEMKVVTEITAELPKDLRIPLSLTTVLTQNLAEENLPLTTKILEQQTEKAKSLTEEIGINLPPTSALNIGVTATIAPNVSSPESKELAEKVDEFTELLESLGAQPPEIKTVLNTLAQNRQALFNQESAVKEVATQLRENNFPPQKAESISSQAIAEKKKAIEEKVAEIIPDCDQETKAELTAVCLVDDYQKIDQITDRIPEISPEIRTDLKESLTYSNQFIAAREIIANQITLPNPTVPDSFHEKLNRHPQVIDQIAGLIANQISQGVKDKNQITTAINAPTALSFHIHGITIEEGQGEEEAVNQIVNGLSDSTLELVAQGEEKFFENSVLNQLEKEISTYLGTKVVLQRPDGSFKYLDMTNKVNQKVSRLLAEYWVQKPTKTSQRFLSLTGEEGETAIENSLKKIPSGLPLNIMQQVNADQDPRAAAAAAAQLALMPPDQLESQISTWQKFFDQIAPAQEIMVIKDFELFNLVPNLEKKENAAVWQGFSRHFQELIEVEEVTDRHLHELIPALKNPETFSQWKDFVNYFKSTDRSNILAKDNLTSSLRTIFGKNGVAEQVYNSHLYRVAHNLKDVFSPATNFFKNKLFKKLGQTAIGKGVKTLWNKGKSFVQEKIFEPIGKWVFEKIGQQVLEKGTEFAVGEGATAAIATFLGVPTAGVSVALWVGWEALKAGYSLIKRGLKAVGIDPVKMSERFAESISALGITPKISRLIEKVGILPDIVKDILRFTVNVFGSLTEDIGLGIAIAPIIVGIFIVLFAFKLQKNMINRTKTPPITEYGGEGVPYPGGEINVTDVDVDPSQCDSYSGSIKNVCIATAYLQACFPSGINSGNMGLNGENVNQCLQKNTELPQSVINHMVSEIKISAGSYTYLQCVGYKRAMEPALPGGVGDAKNYVGHCEHVYSEGQVNDELDKIKAGDNAVWVSGAFGHIAIIIDPLPSDSEHVLTAQAWGGKGNVNFTTTSIASITEIIRCN